MKEQKRYSLYIADDHQIIIDGIQLLLGNESNIEIVGSALDGEQACNDLMEIKPDLAILDIRMPQRSGIQILQQLHKKIPTRFIILTMQMDKRMIVDAENYGASGFLLKNSGKEELISCINTVIKGQTFFSKMLIQTQPTIGISPRETDILKLVLKGLTTQQISEELHISHYTVETHRKNVYRKTQCNNLASLLRYAMDNNISVD
ncbi:MAG: response regulator transcription factor [Bacteroidota bacterium]